MLARARPWLTALAADAQFALRHFRRRLATSLTMLVVLTAGVVLSAALFSFVYAYATEPPNGIARLPDLVRLRGSQITGEGRSNRRFSADELHDYETLNTHFSAVAGWTNEPVSIELPGRGAGRSIPAMATFVTADYFSVLGVHPIGRAANEPSTAVISHALWDALYAKDPAAIGTSLTVNGLPVTIVGIAPPSFNGVDGFDHLQVFLPLGDRAVFVPDIDRGAEVFGAAARLRPGVGMLSASAATAATANAATTAADRIAAPTIAIDSAQRRIVSTDIVPLLAANGDANFDADVRLLTLALAGVGLLVLLVTCTNVSALQTGLAMARRREIAIRLSMGAGRARIVRQLLTESVLLAGVAAAAALTILAAIEHLVVPRLSEMPFAVTLDWQAVAFTLGIALTAGVAFGLSPALHATRASAASGLKESAVTVRRARLQRALVIAQIGCTQPLIVGFVALLLIVIREYRRTAFTASADHIVALQLRSASSDANQREVPRLRARLAALPGIAAVVPNPRSGLPQRMYRVQPSDRSAASPEASVTLAGPFAPPGYLDAMNVRLVLGRDFDASDVRAASTTDALPVIIGDGLARLLWPNANPLGRRLQPAGARAADQRTLIVVGVAALPAEPGTDPDDIRRMYVAADSTRIAGASDLLIRTVSDAETLMPQIRRTVRLEAPGLSVVSMRTFADLQGGVRSAFFVGAAVLAGACVLALLLSAIGLYAVVSFAVQERTNEIAVRMAIGARVQQIVGRFVGDGVRLSAAGLLFGLPASLIALELLMRVPDGLPPLRITPIAAIAAVGVAVVALTASWIPARRAAAVDPASVLRRE
jgi:predicted permease